MWSTLLLYTTCWQLVNSLTLLERNELSRKFKYYFKSVRPIAKENWLSNENGTHFTISTEIQLLNTVRVQNSVAIEVFVVCTLIDDRLLLRELFDRFEVTEFEPWEPRISTSPVTTLKKSVFLSPQTGELTIYYRVKEVIVCSADAWKHPFEKFTCDLIVENGGDEVLRIVEHRDIRPYSQTKAVGVEIFDWPSPIIRFEIASEWHTVLVSVFLPSALIFAVVVFAQWKRRKIQIIVTVTALICIVIQLSSQRSYPSLTLRDLWLCSTFLHTVFLLIIDLTLPARRVRYTLMVDVNGKPTMTSPETPRGSPGDFSRRSASSPQTHTVYSGSTVEAGNEDVTRAPLCEDELSEMGSPLPGRKALMAIQKIAGRTFGQSKVEHHVIRGCPGQEVPIQRHITANSLGYRKRMALLAVCCSYLLFIIIYLIIILCAL